MPNLTNKPMHHKQANKPIKLHLTNSLPQIRPTDVPAEGDARAGGGVHAPRQHHRRQEDPAPLPHPQVRIHTYTYYVCTSFLHIKLRKPNTHNTRPTNPTPKPTKTQHSPHTPQPIQAPEPTHPTSSPPQKPTPRPNPQKKHSLLRRHPSPSRERFEPLIAAAAAKGFTLCVDDSRALQQSLDAAVDPADAYVNKIIRIMATRCVCLLFCVVFFWGGGKSCFFGFVGGGGGGGEGGGGWRGGAPHTHTPSHTRTLLDVFQTTKQDHPRDRTGYIFAPPLFDYCNFIPNKPDHRIPSINRINPPFAPPENSCMFPAQYFCSGEYPQEEWHHYGLAAPIYTHFTSPIRRCVIWSVVCWIVWCAFWRIRSFPVTPPPPQKKKSHTYTPTPPASPTKHTTSTKTHTQLRRRGGPPPAGRRHRRGSLAGGAHVQGRAARSGGQHEPAAQGGAGACIGWVDEWMDGVRGSSTYPAWAVYA